MKFRNLLLHIEVEMSVLETFQGITLNIFSHSLSISISHTHSHTFSRMVVIQNEKKEMFKLLF